MNVPLTLDSSAALLASIEAILLSAIVTLCVSSSIWSKWAMAESSASLLFTFSSLRQAWERDNIDGLVKERRNSIA